MLKKDKIKKSFYERDDGTARLLKNRVKEREKKIMSRYDVISLKEHWIPEKYIGNIRVPEACRIDVVYKNKNLLA